MGKRYLQGDGERQPVMSLTSIGYFGTFRDANIEVRKAYFNALKHIKCQKAARRLYSALAKDLVL